ncbi:hypothetical protein PMAYCL1PPCAC_06262 [Pristionchus mayeri]|uniref:Uncharacterized protein n=1 Tax=Pristionchus mayeri TaxID=1317129 RepID=A0AAN4Z7V4_9BILA|nr:hypothetical protein PMAYCL1PPCAC_06262 [Pristionchus mayeri]
MHRGKLILTQTSNYEIINFLCHVSNTVMLLRMPPWSRSAYLHDSSSIHYLLLPSQMELILVNTKTLAVDRVNCLFDPSHTV